SGSGSGSGSVRDPWDPPASGAAQADPDAPPDVVTTKALADKACPKVIAPYFYRIEKHGKVSYALGSRHIGVSLAKLPPGIKQQLEAASLVVFEVPPGDEGEESPAALTSVPDQLGPALWDRYRKLVGSANATAVEHESPLVAMVTLMALYEDKTSMLDTEIQQLVTGAHIATAGLESSTFQDKLLVELLDTRMLKATVAGTPDRATLEREAVEDLNEYCAGTDETPGMDVHSRTQLEAAGYSKGEIARIDDKMVDARNRAWIPKLDTMFTKGRVFVVVGADHLVGPRGVIALLAARGWKTTRVAP
ncbi:MAG: GumN family protein, partial [Deltaproteobacteria bacterium]|nr:GumN family protein [Deltaproteobacteria bacterium]